MLSDLFFPKQNFTNQNGRSELTIFITHLIAWNSSEKQLLHMI